MYPNPSECLLALAFCLWICMYSSVSVAKYHSSLVLTHAHNVGRYCSALMSIFTHIFLPHLAISIICVMKTSCRDLVISNPAFTSDAAVGLKSPYVSWLLAILTFAISVTVLLDSCGNSILWIFVPFIETFHWEDSVWFAVPFLYASNPFWCETSIGFVLHSCFLSHPEVQNLWNYLTRMSLPNFQCRPTLLCFMTSIWGFSPTSLSWIISRRHHPIQRLWDPLTWTDIDQSDLYLDIFSASESIAVSFCMRFSERVMRAYYYSRCSLPPDSPRLPLSLVHSDNGTSPLMVHTSWISRGWQVDQLFVHQPPVLELSDHSLSLCGILWG